MRVQLTILVVGLLVGEVVVGCGMRRCCRDLGNRLDHLSDLYERMETRTDLLVNQACGTNTTESAICAAEDMNCPADGLVHGDLCYTPLYNSTEKNFNDALDECIINNFTGLAIIDSRERYDKISLHLNTYADANLKSVMSFMIGTLYYHDRNETWYMDGRMQTWESPWGQDNNTGLAPDSNSTMTRMVLTAASNSYLARRGYYNVDTSSLVYPLCQRSACWEDE